MELYPVVAWRLRPPCSRFRNLTCFHLTYMNTAISLYSRLSSEILKLHLISLNASYGLPCSPSPGGGFWRLEAIHITILPHILRCAHAEHSHQEICSAHSPAVAVCSTQSAVNLSLAAQGLGSLRLRDIDEYGPLHGGTDRSHATCPVCASCVTPVTILATAAAERRSLLGLSPRSSRDEACGTSRA